MADHYVAQTTARFGSQSTLDEACAVASQVAGRTIVPGGQKQHVRDQHLTLLIVRAVSGLDGARLGFGDNLIRYATHNVQKTRLTPSFADCIELTNVRLCLHGSVPGAEYVIVLNYTSLQQQQREPSLT